MMPDRLWVHCSYYSKMFIQSSQSQEKNNPYSKKFPKKDTKKLMKTVRK